MHWDDLEKFLLEYNELYMGDVDKSGMLDFIERIRNNIESFSLQHHFMELAILEPPTVKTRTIIVRYRKGKKKFSVTFSAQSS